MLWKRDVACAVAMRTSNENFRHAQSFTDPPDSVKNKSAIILVMPLGGARREGRALAREWIRTVL